MRLNLYNPMVELTCLPVGRGRESQRRGRESQRRDSSWGDSTIWTGTTSRAHVSMLAIARVDLSFLACIATMQ